MVELYKLVELVEMVEIVETVEIVEMFKMVEIFEIIEIVEMVKMVDSVKFVEIVEMVKMVWGGGNASSEKIPNFEHSCLMGSNQVLRIILINVQYDKCVLYVLNKCWN